MSKTIIDWAYYDTLEGKIELLNHAKKQLAEDADFYERFPLFKKNVLPHKLSYVESLEKEIEQLTTPK